MLFYRLLIISFFICSFFSLNAEEGITWLTHYQKAVEKSRSENKPLLLFFTGSDWSGWSMKMKKETLDAEDFVSKMGDRFICVQIDFPLHKKLAEDEISQNQKLKEKWEITEYPRIILLDSSEREIARLGYTPENGNKFANDLIHILETDAALTQAMAKLSTHAHSAGDLETLYRQAQELQRKSDATRILECGLKCQDPLFFLLEKYRLLVEEGKSGGVETADLRKRLVNLDPENKRGVQFSLALIDFQNLSQQDYHSIDPKNVIKPLEDYLQRYSESDKDNVWRVEMMIAQFYLDYDECTTALKHAEMAFRTAPSEMKEEIERSLEYIRKQTGFTAQVPQ